MAQMAAAGAALRGLRALRGLGPRSGAGAAPGRGLRTGRGPARGEGGSGAGPREMTGPATWMFRQPKVRGPAAAAAAEAEAKALTPEERKRAEEAAAFSRGVALGDRLMFPWERRALRGQDTPLHSWEKAYWAVFLAAMAYLAYELTVNRNRADPEAERRAALAAARRDRAGRKLAGESFITDEDDPFEDLTPEEITALVAEATQGAAASLATAAAAAEDEFDGLSPDEINALVARRAAERLG